MIFGFGRGGRDDDDEEEDDEEEEMDFVLFQGALNGNNPDLSENQKLVQVGLLPAKRLVTDALSRGAEMIRLDTKGKVAAATFFIDGVPYPASRMPAQAALAITQMLKLLAGLDIKVRNKPQAGAINAEYDEIKFQIRINVQPVQGGTERLIVRAHDLSLKLETPKDLRFSDQLVKSIRDISEKKSGVIAVAGPPFSGVTTVAIATLRAIDAYLYSLYCLADIEGRDLSHVKMFEKLPDDDLTQTLRRCRREDSDVVLVDPMTSQENTLPVFNAANEMVLIAETPARDAADGIARLVQYTEDANLVAERLDLILSQMLVRLLCQKCRRAYRPHPKLLAKVGLPPETAVLYRPPQADDEEEDEEDICEYCDGVGYAGRIGLIEVIELTEAIQQTIRDGADPKAIRAQARNEKMQTFQSDGLRLVAEGLTSLEELQRAFKGTKS